MRAKSTGTEKRCSRCKVVKHIDEFSKAKNGPLGRGAYCYRCKATTGRENRHKRKGIIHEADIARFWSRIDKNGPMFGDRGRCWIWQGAPRNSDGYGQYHWAGKLTSPHLVALFLAGRVAPPDKPLADHECQQRMCCNPDHLRFVSEYVNGVENNGSPLAKNAAKTHCINGHEFTPENTALVRRVKPNGRVTFGRQCLTCWPTNWRQAIVPRDPPPGARRLRRDAP